MLNKAKKRVAVFGELILPRSQGIRQDLVIGFRNKTF